MFYKVTRKFIGGILEGLEHEGITSVEFKTGEVFEKPFSGSSPFKIIKVEALK